MESMNIFLEWTRISSFSSSDYSFDLSFDDMEGEWRREGDYEGEEGGFSPCNCKGCQPYIYSSEEEDSGVEEEEAEGCFGSETSLPTTWRTEDGIVTVTPLSSECPGPFAAILSRLLSPSHSPLHSNRRLIPATVPPVMGPPTLSSESCCTSSSSIESLPVFPPSSLSHFNSTAYVLLNSRLENSDEKERLLDESTTASSTTVSSITSDWEGQSECEASKAMVIRLLKECDEMEKKIEEMKKKLMKMMGEE
ncbi:hypothetical protein PMAYCL1PPCAC_07363, partial [Pristionchus mayeri]